MYGWDSLTYLSSLLESSTSLSDFLDPTSKTRTLRKKPEQTIVGIPPILLAFRRRLGNWLDVPVGSIR